jgi:hypothetical protein
LKDPSQEMRELILLAENQEYSHKMAAPLRFRQRNRIIGVRRSSRRVLLTGCGVAFWVKLIIQQNFAKLENNFAKFDQRVLRNYYFSSNFVLYEIAKTPFHDQPRSSRRMTALMRAQTKSPPP